MSDEEMVDFLDHTLMEPEGPRPSVETFLHAFVAEKVVLHSHANAILSLADTVEAERLIAEVYEGRIPAIGYVNSGFPWPKRSPRPTTLIPKRPALSCSATASSPGARPPRRPTGAISRSSPRRSNLSKSGRRVERFLRPARGRFPRGRVKATAKDKRPNGARSRHSSCPRCKGLVSRREPYVIHYEDSDIVTAFVDSKEAAILSQVGPVTPDHMRYTKRVACYVPVDDPANVKGLVEG